MEAKDLIKAGRLSEARRQLTDEVKASPAQVPARVLLFQVLCLYGEWDKAGRHLDVIASQDASSEIGVQAYRNLLQAERERQEVMGFTRRPTCLPRSPAYLDHYLTACQNIVQDKVEAASELFRQLDAVRLPLQGKVNGEGFVGFRDTDSFFSFFLEAMVPEQYIWIPMDSVKELSVSSPKTLFDLLWISAQVVTWEGLNINCFLPVLYPNSFLHEDDRIKMGRMTDWVPLGGAFSKGVGQHVFEIGEKERALLEIRELTFFNPSDDDGS